MRRLYYVLLTGILLGFLMLTSSSGVAADAPYECKTGDDYVDFVKDYSGVTQVCPANNNNYSKDGMATTGPLYVVIHATGNADATAVQGNINQFQDKTKIVSAHYLVGLDENGVVQVIQMVPEKYKAYHAGDTAKLGTNTIDNTNSVGIEVVGQGDLADWPADNVRTEVAKLVADIARRAKASGRDIQLDRDSIVGHEEISTAGKWDPGPFWNWQELLENDLGGVYTPAAVMSAERNVGTNEISLSVKARYNGRTHYRLEVSEDEGPYQPIDGIEPISNTPRSKPKNTASTPPKNPTIFELYKYTPSAPKQPTEYCYRAVALRNETQYANPSDEGCVIIGQRGQSYSLPRRDSTIISQGTYPIVKPGEAVRLAFTLRNTGILSWKTGGRYALVNTGGESFGLQTQLLVPAQIMAYQDLVWELPLTAPQQSGAYATSWQMAVIDPTTHAITLFGEEIGYIVTVVPGGGSSDLGQIVRKIIDEALRSATESLDTFLANLQAQILEEIKQRTTHWWSSWCNSLWGPGLGAPGIVLWLRRKRRH